MTTVSEAIKTKAAVREETITRFDIHQRIQHFFLMTSFVVLVLTGFPLKFAGAAASQWWISVLGGIEIARQIHHVAAWVMLGDCAYHAIYLVITIGFMKRPFPIKMIPSLRDFNLLIHEIAYFVGLRKDKPAYDRFNWKEKFDYWAMFWGIPMMGLSGLVLMFPVFATKYLPGWVVPVSLIAHSDEAMLALTWIMIVHVFFNHFTPGVFPWNPSIFTGKLTKERYQSEHPVEYARIVNEENKEKAGEQIAIR